MRNTDSLKKAFLYCFLLLTVSLKAQPYWQQQVDYRIRVALNDTNHSIDGDIDITYQNNSPDTLRFIWIHLWPNAYKNDKTAFSDQLLENDNTRFYFSKPEEKGYINKLDFKVNGITARLEDHPEHIDIGKLILPAPLKPGEQIRIRTPFHVKLPFNFSRGGHDGQSYQLTQWYPKPAVYDQKGWHPMPYLDQGEFYSEFGSYDVQITVPQNYVVAATGELQQPEEKKWLKSRASFNWEPLKQKIKTSGGQLKTITQLFPASDKDIKILRYKQDRVHDFAWFADKRYIVNMDTCRLPSGRIIDVMTCYTPEQSHTWKKSIQYTKDAVRFYSEKIGEYPYNTVTAVQGPESFGGGMEYPTITVISPERIPADLDFTIAHEVGHNWFYGILASNERIYPWMDEGLNSFYEYKYQALKTHHYRQRTEQDLLNTMITEGRDQPINTPAALFTGTNYGLIAYYKTAEWMALLEKELGAGLLDSCMQAYFTQWQFKHPQPGDFRKVLEETSGRNLEPLFSLLDKKGPLPGKIKKGTRIQTPGKAVKNLLNGSNKDKKTVINLGIVPGFNSYDKFMAGIAVTNLRFPANQFQFLAIPLYGFGSKKLNGTGFMNYTIRPQKKISKIDAGISVSSFTADRYTDPDGNKTFLRFSRLVPGLRFTVAETSPRSSRQRYIQFRSFFLKEDALSFYRDTVISGPDTSISTKYKTISGNSILHQLKLVAENNRKLYPWRAELKVESGKDFIRSAFTGNYFFNYGNTGGMKVRLFAGSFFYTTGKSVSKQFSTGRYHLNLSGPNGYEDYTYSDYFIGRKAFEGFASQQMMERDGAFKVRTDLLAEKTGRTDNWLIAANFSSSIPGHLNPLQVLPVSIPVKLFADIGTVAEAWESGSTDDRFLFDGGVQLSLFRETLNIYIPLVYSNVYRYYYESTIPKKERFWKKVSFSIDISNFSFRNIDRNFTF